MRRCEGSKVHHRTLNKSRRTSVTCKSQVLFPPGRVLGAGAERVSYADSCSPSGLSYCFESLCITRGLLSQRNRLSQSGRTAAYRPHSMGAATSAYDSHVLLAVLQPPVPPWVLARSGAVSAESWQRLAPASTKGSSASSRASYLAERYMDHRNVQTTPIL